MEKSNFIEAKKEEDQENESIFEEKKLHHEAMSFVAKNKDILDHYTKGRVNVEPAPEGLNTFAFNLENNTIYVNDMFYKDFNFSEEKTMFAILHEIEHFSEKKQILEEKGGEKLFENYLKMNKRSKAFGVMDNCIADIRENRTVVSRTNEGMGELEKKIYKENLFKEIDFKNHPKHLQFCQAILREERVPEEECKIDDVVRSEINKIKKIKGFMDVLTHPDTPMSTRIRLQNKFIWPIVEKLLNKDLEDQKKKQQDKQEQDKNKPDGSGDENKEKSKEQNEQKKGSGNSNQDEKEDKENKKNGKDGKGEQPREEPGDKKEGKLNSQNKGADGKKGNSGKELDPNEIFKNEYEEIKKKFPEAMSLPEMEKALSEWKENKKEGNKNSPDEDYAKSLDVSVKDLQNYRKIVEELSKIRNPETDVAVVEELKNLFSRIISKRTKKILQPKYPTEEGEELIDPGMLIASVKAGDLNPKVWQDLEIKEKKGDHFGEVEVTLVCDRSGSMTEGDKAIAQKKSAVLLMEALKEFSEMCQTEKMNDYEALEVSSEVYTFSGDEEDKIPLKKMSKDLGETERINVLKKLNQLEGETTDFVCLESILSKLNKESEEKIKEGKLKKIVIVMTDGDSNEKRVQKVLKDMTEIGLVVVGIGMTISGTSVRNTYRPNGLVVEDIKDLPVILTELLKNHLKNL
jgi:hypothetical protein